MKTNLKKLAPYISTLEKIISENSAARPYQTMSDMLHLAATDIIKAIQSGDYTLASQLAACKSYVIGIIDPNDHENAFQEEQNTNEAIFGNSVYTTLDSINFNLAMMIGCTPAGMTVITKRKDRIIAQGAPTPNLIHPVIQRMAYEQKVIVENAGRTFITPPIRRKIIWV